ncbi:hypothetical protein [Actinospongicola halichondriae]|uniref:hypothetical protein n=1 Tax=Actinospongicola halichondriae TaxID=3236844 RepID=UPI003D5052BB
MRVFVLTTGRAGSVTFSEACRHASNYSVGHETRIGAIRDRLEYPDNHIEVDNRLAWFLGSLSKRYPDAFYVHLTRGDKDVVRSYSRRHHEPDAGRPSIRTAIATTRRVRRIPTSIVSGFLHGVLFRMEPWTPEDLEEGSALMVHTINDNISEFLRDKPHINVALESATTHFSEFWRRIGASGNLDRALAEFSTRHNESQPSTTS